MQYTWAISSVASPAVQYFSTLSHKRNDFRKKKGYWTQNVFWFSLQLLSETFLILRRNERDVIKNVYCSLFLSDLNKTWIFFWLDFRYILKYQISWKSIQWEPSCSMRTDGRRSHMTKLIAAFLNSANAPKKGPLKAAWVWDLELKIISTKPLYDLSPSSIRATCPTHLPWFGHPTEIW